MNVRTVIVKDRHYIRTDDVVSLLRELAETEPTDTRNRINSFAETLEQAAIYEMLPPHVKPHPFKRSQYAFRQECVEQSGGIRYCGLLPNNKIHEQTK